MIRKIKAGLLVMCLLMLSGCSTPPEPIIVTKVETHYLRLPAVLMRACPIPEPTTNLRGNSDLSNHILQLYAALDSCNTDKSDLRKKDAEYQEASHGSTQH